MEMSLPNLRLPTLPQLHQTALQSFDMGSVYSADGREHPVTSLIPVRLDAENVAAAKTAVVETVANKLNPFALPEHFGARMVVGILAVGILLLVTWRLIKP